MKYNCIIIGSGPAGFYSAMSCAKKGYKTAIVEKELFGGTGFRTGCLPVKRNLDILRKVEEAISLSAGELSRSPDFRNNLLWNTETYMSGVEGMITNRLQKAGIDIYTGNGRFINAKTFLIEDKKLETDYFIIATGTAPASPPGIELDSKRVISHIEALKLKTLPDKMTIIGGNVEGIEMASLFSSLGVKITIIEQLDLILDGTDRDLIQPVMDDLTSKGVNFLTGVKAESVEISELQATVILNTRKRIDAEKVLVTALRQMNIPDGIETTGIEYTRDGIPVNKNLQTNIPSIFAAGDVNGIHGMAHIAIQQGMLITKGLEGKKVIRNYSSLPRAMFTLPEIAGAGKQEWELIKDNTPYRIEKYAIKDTWRGFSREINSGFIKLIFNARDILIGIWMTSADASEILSTSGILIEQNLTESMIIDNLFIHPTLGEGIIEAIFKNI